jgi:hypothetical protein
MQVCVLTVSETKQVLCMFVCLFDRKRHCDVIIQSLIMMTSTELRHRFIRQVYSKFNSAI